MWSRTSRGVSTTQNKLLKRQSGIQPQYFPRLHYFARAVNSDIFVISDDVQFVKNHKYPDGKRGKSYQAHTPIKQSYGIQYFLVPTKHSGLNSINKTFVSYDHKWIPQQLNSLRAGYNKAKKFSTLFEQVQSILKSQPSTLADLNTKTFLWGLLNLLGEEDITLEKLTLEYTNKKLQEQNIFRLKKAVLGSSLDCIKMGMDLRATERLIAIFKELEVNEDYCGGTAVDAYVDRDLYTKNNVKITVQDWKCRKYPQLFEKQQGFMPNLSIIDLLMNVPASEAAKIISG